MRKTIFVLSTWCIALLCIFLFYREANNSDQPLNLRMLMDYISSYKGFDAFQSVIYSTSKIWNNLDLALSNIFNFTGVLDTLLKIGTYLRYIVESIFFVLLIVYKFLEIIIETFWWILGFFELLI